MAEAALKLMTVDEFVHWDDGTDARYQLIEGQPMAMAPPWTNHGTIAVNTGRQLANRLDSRPACRAISEAGVRISDLTYFVADVAVTCEPPRNGPWVDEPSLLVEVLSPSTRREDFAIKLPAYQRIEALQEIWLVDSERRWVQLWRRDGVRRWIVEDFVGAAELESVLLGDRVPLDEIYRNVALEEDGEEAGIGTDI